MNTENSNKETLNDVFKSADLSDQLWVFFSKYSRALWAIVLIISILSVIAIATAIGQNIAKKSMEAAYLEALRSGNKEIFAEKYISSSLGGSIFLELADQFYQKEDYQKAADYYHHALNGLRGTVFGGRAAIGEGVASIKLGLQPEGEIIFSNVAEEKSYPLFIRGNAMYFLAISIYDRKDFGQAKNILNKLINGQFPDRWKMEAKNLLHEIEITQ